MKTKPLITVIIPVCNTGKYLEECVGSVLCQTYGDLEIILVDDGSTDDSPDICGAYARKDLRIRALHQENQGLSAARNSGLLRASGDYVCYVDSDDVLHPDYIKILLAASRKTGADAAGCGLVSFPDGTSPDFDRPGRIGIKTMSGYEFLKRMLDHTQACNCCGILYKRTAVDGLYFEKGRLCEDVMYNCEAADRIKKFAAVSAGLYGYRQTPDSLMRRKLTRRSFDMLQVEEQRIRYLQEHHPELAEQARITLTETALRFLYKVDLHAEKDDAAYLREKTILCVKQNGLTWPEIAQAKCEPFTKASLIGAKVSMRGTVWLNHLRKGTIGEAWGKR